MSGFEAVRIRIAGVLISGVLISGGLALAGCATAPAPPSAEPAAAAVNEVQGEPIQQVTLELDIPAAEDIPGYTRARARDVFGMPGLIQEDRGVEVWQYPNEVCVLFLFIYEEPDGNWRASHVEATAAQDMPEPEPEELGAFLNQCVATAARAHQLKKTPADAIG